jgi:3-phenylpropionate/trans-cinnamate dioxygenase ferredoxin reductase subunit
VSGVIIAGGGQGGYQAAASLRTEGYEGPITIVSEDPHIPYQRPPLSKAFVLGKQDGDRLLLRPEAFYAERNIELLLGERVHSIDRSSLSVRLRSGTSRTYDWLVLATGASNRKLPVKGAELDGVCYVRTLDEATDLKARLEAARNVVVIGGGFIGLEIAATSRILGKQVTVLEVLPRLMARAVAPVLSDYFLQSHREKGVDVRLASGCTEILGSGKATGVVLIDGSVLPADLVVVGIGVAPNVELAREAGLAISNGIAADEFLKTSDEKIFAIGDCVEYPNPFAGGRVRLESVQNAVDNAVAVARTITGKPAPYNAVPWFWSDQFEIRLQMAGLSTGFDQSVLRGTIESRKFSVFYFAGRKLLGIDSVNRPADHMAGRKLLGSQKTLTPEQASDESISLKDL